MSNYQSFRVGQDAQNFIPLCATDDFEECVSNTEEFLELSARHDNDFYVIDDSGAVVYESPKRSFKSYKHGSFSVDHVPYATGVTVEDCLKNTRKYINRAYEEDERPSFVIIDSAAENPHEILFDSKNPRANVFESYRDFYNRDIPILHALSVEDCVKRTKRYLHYNEEFVVLNKNTQELVYDTRAQKVVEGPSPS